MDIDQKLELLSKTQKLEVPPFLLTRILARIESSKQMAAPQSWRLTFVAATLTILFLNVFILIKSVGKQNGKDIEQFVSALELYNLNDLYGD